VQEAAVRLVGAGVARGQARDELGPRPHRRQRAVRGRDRVLDDVALPGHEGFGTIAQAPEPRHRPTAFATASTRVESGTGFTR
ncbi:MAG: hypothetical protein ACK559_30880, partial [bacterium]